MCSASKPMFLFISLFLLLALPVSSYAHGVAGKRFFPTTFQVDDPFVSDEFSLLVDHIKQPAEEGGSVRSTGYSAEYSKRILPNLGLMVGDSYQHLKTDEGSTSGWGNLSLGAKWQALTSEKHEAIVSLGTEVEIGGTGARRIAENTTTVGPALFFGKGLGDLPDGAGFIKPFAITGAVGPELPTSSNVPTFLSWGFTLQYSLQYLQSYVRDIGLGAPFNRMTLVAEFPLETCLDMDCKGETTGTINPGILWYGKSVEFGLAAQLPINSRSGNSVGVLALFHLFLDDIFPNTLGRPIFP